MTDPHANAIEAAADALHAETISQPDGAFLVVGDSMKAAQAAVQAYLAARESEVWVMVPVEQAASGAN